MSLPFRPPRQPGQPAFCQHSGAFQPASVTGR